jgi:two-component system nitrate/nitrite response regulator NarL
MNILIVDDDQVLCVALANYLERELKLSIEGTIKAISVFKLAQALEILQSDTRPDLVLLDLNLRNEINGIDTVRECQKNNKFRVPVALLTGLDFDERSAVELLRICLNELNICGFLPKGADIESNVRGLTRIISGELYFPHQVLLTLAKVPPAQAAGSQYQLGLTPREWSVAELLVCGLRDKEIARKLNLKPYYVGQVLNQIYEKLGVHSRLEAAMRVKEATNSPR